MWNTVSESRCDKIPFEMLTYWLMSHYIATQHGPMFTKPGEVECYEEFRNIVYPVETEWPRDLILGWSK